MSVKTLIINNIPVAAEEGKTILEAAKESGIHIPTLCYLEGVSPAAACRQNAAGPCHAGHRGAGAGPRPGRARPAWAGPIRRRRVAESADAARR